MRLAEVAERCNLATLQGMPPIPRAFALAEGVQALRQAVEPLLPSILPLMNSRLGFLTDKRGPTYPVDVVRDCVVEALCRGLNLIGNEWNIIGGNCYTTKEGYERLVGELPGLTDLDLSPGVPTMRDGGALVRVHATWCYQGKALHLTDDKGQSGRTFAIRVNAGMGADAILGKATRKALKAIYQKSTGCVHADGEVGEAVPLLSRTETVAAKLGAPAPEVDPDAVAEAAAIAAEGLAAQ